MSSKYEHLTELYELTAKKLTSSTKDWTSFMRFACHNYKCSFDEQICIYSQKPDATAVLEMGKWNTRFGRWVNKGTKGIGVLTTNNNNHVKYYFDISDTHESRSSTPVPIWEIKPQYENAVIERLENTFGELNSKIDLASALISVANNAVDDNIQDYYNELLSYSKDSNFENTEDVEDMYKDILQQSIGYMILTRCNVDTNEYYSSESFKDILKFNTKQTRNVLGTPIFDISELILREIGQVVFNQQRIETNQNNAIDIHYNSMYNVLTSNTVKGDIENGSNISLGRGLSYPQSESSGRGNTDNTWQVRTNAHEISQEKPQNNIHESFNRGQAVSALSEDRTTGRGNDGTVNQADEGSSERNGRIEDERPNDLGRRDERNQTFSEGNSSERSYLQLNYYNRETEDKSLPFFDSDKYMKKLLISTPHLKVSMQDIAEYFYNNTDDKKRIDFLKSIFNKDWTEILVGEDNKRLGYKTYQNGLRLWEGSYLNPTAKGFYDWEVISDYFYGMTLLGELTNMQSDLYTANQQIAFIENNAASSNTFQLPQEFIDYDLQCGSGFQEGKYQIYEHFLKHLTSQENARFLSNEYGTGGHSSYISGTGISTWHDGKGLSFTKDDKKLLLSWNKVAKRIGELIAADRYLNSKEKEQYPLWLKNEEERRHIAEEERIAKGILSKAPDDNSNNELKELENTQTAHDEQEVVECVFSVGSNVYIGADECEILSVDNEIVRLYDTAFPLFNKEIPLPEFNRMVRENPLNDHLIKFNLPHDVRISRTYNNKISTYIALHDDMITNGSLVYGTYDDYKLASVGLDELRKSLENPEIMNATYLSLPNDSKEPIETTTQDIQDVQIITDDSPGDTTEKAVENIQLAQNGLLEEQTDNQTVEITPAWEKVKKKVKAQSFDLYPKVPYKNRINYRITNNELGHGGLKDKFNDNVNAIKLLKQLELESRYATPTEQEILSMYVGWGGLSDAFDENKTAWTSQYTQLKALLDESEYSAARESTLTAFYTAPSVIQAMYKTIENMGFNNGNILEPSCGIGNFIGMLPDSLKDCKVYGVELDSISGRIAQQLYQQSNIAVQGYEKTNLPDSFFDVSIGNVPFGQFKVSDKRYDKNNFLIHDYFLAKSLDKVRPGGVIAFITSKGTLDKENPIVRKYIAQRAELLGAIRLPNNTFKANAGTEVTSDIIFLQKRDRIIDIEPDWVHLGIDDNDIKMNSYFVDNPDMILGDMVMESTQYGFDSTCRPFENTELDNLLNDAIINIHAEITEYQSEDTDVDEDISIPADPNVRNFSYTLYEGNIYFRENSRMNKVDCPVTMQSRIKGMIEIRDCVRTLIEYQTEDYSDSDIKLEQDRLNTLYDTFTKKYGLINSRANNKAFSEDSSYCLLCSLEDVNENGELIRKADMFTKRTIKQHKAVTSVDTASEALAVSLAEKACVDMNYMANLTGKSHDEIENELTGVIFRNPSKSSDTVPYYEAADEYLSGNVREKLNTAKQFVDIRPELYSANVKALEAVQPKELTASEISVRLGASWIPEDVVKKFIFELLQPAYYLKNDINVHYFKLNAAWNIEGKSVDRNNIKANTTYGTNCINAYKILEDTLNLKDVRIYDYVEDNDGKKRQVLNKKETTLAQQKQELIKNEFSEWVWKDQSRRETLCKIYNKSFNSVRPREYDGSHINFSGMNPEIKLRPHQVNAIAHVMYGGNTLLAHVVGAGKTYEMVASAMESKRLGLCQKSMFVVPNHLTEQWASEFLQLYPAANILVTTKKEFETKNRKKFCGRIATGDYDAIIIGHSQFEKLPMSIERQQAILQQQLDVVLEGIDDVKRNNGERFTIKQLERTRKSIELKLEKLNDQSRKDDVVTFEELGVDRLFVDEAHCFKNLFSFTKMRNVAGIAQTEAKKSSDLFMKCRYLDELTGGRGVVFATGTPISNSMTEMYTMQRYLQYHTLENHGLQHFDAWASTFGETVTAIELSPEGTGYRAKTRFAKFYNLPELMSMFKDVADIQTADMLNLPVPKANYHNVVLKPSEMQKEMVASLSERAEKVRNKMVDSSVDNMLLITGDGRKLALDQRLMNEMLPDFEESKVSVCANNVFDIWEKTKADSLAQLVFCDLSTPHNDGRFNVYDDIKEKLIAKGVPPDEIAFIHEADTDVKKKLLFDKVRSGHVRVLMGSTSKMGAGTNVQKKLVALHNIDCPWRPSDLAQRAGRILRQGNENSEVEIFSYVTENTFDAYLYQILENKQKFISQIMTSKSPVRSAEDVDEAALSYAEIKALATGNPLIKEKMDLDVAVSKLKLYKANYLSQRYALEDQIVKTIPKQIIYNEERIAGYKADILQQKENTKPNKDGFSPMVVKGVTYTEKKDAGNAIIEACKNMSSPAPIDLGVYRGFNMELSYDALNKEYNICIKNTMSHTIKLSSDTFGNITRLDNVLDSFEYKLKACENILADIKVQLETAKNEVAKPFAQEDELKTTSARLDELNILLNMDQNDDETENAENKKDFSNQDNESEEEYEEENNSFSMSM